MKEKFELIKQHIIKHKEAYIAGTVGVVLGILVGYEYARSKDGKYEIIKIDTLGSSTVVLNKGKETNNTFKTISMYGNDIGRPGKPVFDTETGKRFESETLAARSVGASTALMSNHLHGNTDHVYGHKFRFAEDEVAA